MAGGAVIDVPGRPGRPKSPSWPIVMAAWRHSRGCRAGRVTALAAGHHSDGLLAFDNTGITSHPEQATIR